MDAVRMDKAAHMRLLNEERELHERIGLLENALGMGILGLIGDDDASDLCEQLAHMRRYRACLQRRLQRQVDLDVGQ